MAKTYFEMNEHRQAIANGFSSAHTVLSYGPFSEEALGNMCDIDPVDTHPEKTSRVDVNELADPHALASFEDIDFT